MNNKFVLLALLGHALSVAQTVPQQAAAAINPDAPAPAVIHQTLEPSGASALVQKLEDWRTANATVGQYPRGHADIVKWERAQQDGRPAPAPRQEPAR